MSDIRGEHLEDHRESNILSSLNGLFLGIGDSVGKGGDPIGLAYLQAFNLSQLASAGGRHLVENGSNRIPIDLEDLWLQEGPAGPSLVSVHSG